METANGGLTPYEQEQLQLAAHAALARQEFLAYASFIDHSYQTPQHIRLLCSYLQAVEKGDITRLAIIAPPRHSKSESTSGKFPGWLIGRDTKRTVMIVCHSADLAETFSIQNRETIARNPRWPLVFPDVAMSTARRSAGIWAVNDRRENVIANGIMGGLTGYGAWLLLFDDPIKTYEQATSVTYREKVWNEYKTAARTRLTPDGRIIMIRTRWNEDDPIGRIKESGEGDDWVILHLPALSYGTEADYVGNIDAVKKLPATAFPDPLGRPKGEALWPSRYAQDFLLNQKLVMGHEFEALYQGNPHTVEGDSFKRAWFRGITDLILSNLKCTPVARARSYDVAWSAAKRADDTVGIRATLYKIEVPKDLENEAVKTFLRVANVPPVLVAVEDVALIHKEWDQTYEDIIQIAEDDTDKYELLVEGVASQNVGFKALRNDPRLSGFRILGVTKVDNDKEARATYPKSLSSKGIVWLVYPSLTTAPDWEDSFLTELAQFGPGCKKDNQVDAFTQLLNHWRPRITKLLNKAVARGQWVTPFMPAQPKQEEDDEGGSKAGVRLPPEFRVGWRRTRRYDRMGWK